ncbi:MAG: hypothetical protein AABX01_01530 [Candidatus Micrarchaeota archaeon]
MINPIAAFKPLELPALLVYGRNLEKVIPKLARKLQETKGLSLDRAKIHPFYSTPTHDHIVVDQETMLANLGVSPDFIRKQRIYAYSLPIHGIERIAELGRDPELVVSLKDQFRLSEGGDARKRANLRVNLKRFGASAGLLMHLLHHRLNLAGTTDEGSMFSDQNIAIGLAADGPVFHDYDTVHPITRKSQESAELDVDIARSSLISLGLEIGASRSLIQQADRALFSVYRTFRKGKYTKDLEWEFKKIYELEKARIKERKP